MSTNEASITPSFDQKVNPLRPYYTPGLHRQHNYTSLPSSDSTPGTLPDLYGDTHTAHVISPTISYALMRYVFSLLSNPFEVGTTLLQVQYSPHRDVEVFAEHGHPKQAVSHTNTSLQYMSSDEDEDEEEANNGFYAMKPKTSTTSNISYNSDIRYLYSVYDSANRPDYQMAPMHGGLLDILNQIIRHSSEGWQSLLKGQRVGWVYNMSRTFLQSFIEHQLNDVFGLYDDISLMHLDSVTGNLSTMLTSHVVVGVLLSPLEIMRTRMIVQSSATKDGPYQGIFRAWASILQDEGGLWSIYTSAKNYWPTILYHSLAPLLHYTAPILVDRSCHISAADHPILYGTATFGLSVATLLITMPLETVRKRLQCQVGTFRQERTNKIKSQPSSTSSFPSSSFQTTVALRPVHYNGILDALYKIMKEEGAIASSTSISKTGRLISTDRKPTYNIPPSAFSSDDEEEENVSVKRTKVTSAWGVRGLYKGFGIQLAASFLMFILQTINGIEDELSGSL